MTAWKSRSSSQKGLQGSQVLKALNEKLGEEESGAREGRGLRRLEKGPNGDNLKEMR